MILLNSIFTSTAGNVVTNISSTVLTVDECTLDPVSRNTEEQLLQVMKYYHCSQLPVGTEYHVSDESDYLAGVSYDTTDISWGEIYIIDIPSSKRIFTYSLPKGTVLEVLAEKMLNDQYLFFIIGSPTGTYCSLLSTDPRYELCNDLEQDLHDTGGGWLFDLESNELKWLFSY